ncbi:hypothetical protein [Pantoea sp. SO10]|uniref:hypothetical protein n=1 Tax=Pantoea sp. SO10 TaxID=2575375 RepID=UPI0010C9C0D6|nr:hypothetical protein [Pantoea sp. SO10]QCP62339.1 hypothetical protein FCN45_23295 [Pantoea sp. SO10]
MNKDINPVANAIGNCSLDSENENAACENIIDRVIYKKTSKAPLFLFLRNRGRLRDRVVFVIEEFITVTSLSKQSITVLTDVSFLMSMPEFFFRICSIKEASLVSLNFVNSKSTCDLSFCFATSLASDNCPLLSSSEDISL